MIEANKTRECYAKKLAKGKVFIVILITMIRIQIGETGRRTGLYFRFYAEHRKLDDDLPVHVRTQTGVKGKAQDENHRG